MGTEQQLRSETVNLRIHPKIRSIIDAAAQVCGKTRTSFVIDAAYHAATETLLEQKTFYLTDEQWEAFNEILDRPTKSNEKLAQLLKEKAPWE
ncbi:MAG: DUF1778 domain-containing protein [Kamptonema sp. SIO1D9]|nr:DUF1778 domain-containing protein [Kamptonema sp. SIO1D9]